MQTRYERQIVIDIDTGEILNNWKHQKREYKTIEIITKKELKNGINWIKTQRHVKHNGQTKISF